MVNGLYSVKEVAEMLNLNVRTVRTYCRKGQIPCIQFGYLYRISSDTVELLKKHGKPRYINGRYVWGEVEEMS